MSDAAEQHQDDDQAERNAQQPEQNWHLLISFFA
jgi:hypothetical protein